MYTLAVQFPSALTFLFWWTRPSSVWADPPVLCPVAAGGVLHNIARQLPVSYTFFVGPHSAPSQTLTSPPPNGMADFCA